MLDKEKAAPARATSKSEQAYNNAITLATQGVPSFPCRGNKAPACLHGFKDATSDPVALKSLWVQYPGSLVGVPTGEITGFDVLDIDPRNGGDKWLDAHCNRLPATRTHQSRSGGKHFYHNGLRCTNSTIATGVDVKADGGCIIWWPAAGLPVLNDAPLAEWPDWLLQALTPIPRSTFVPDTIPMVDGNTYASAALRKAAISVATAREGCRNDTLNREVWSLLRFVSDGRLRVQDIVNTLAAAALSSGLARPEVLATLISALRARGIS